MFKKRKCKNCGEKVSSKNNFCPKCGSPIDENIKKEDYGMLGSNDFEEAQNQIPNSLFGGFGGKIMGKMINNVMKSLEKEMEKSMKEMDKQNPDLSKNPNFELYINGKKINPENIKITKKPIGFNPVNEKPKTLNNRFFSTENTKRFAKFPKQEPQTNLRRLSNKVIYEISIPGVKSIDDISIVKLENSIEIKAVSQSEQKAYSKRIPVNLDISKYTLSNGKLILELTE